MGSATTGHKLLQDLPAQKHRVQEEQQSSECMLSGTNAHKQGGLLQSILYSNIMHESP